MRCDIELADAILCFDASLLDGRLLAAAGPQTLIVTNSARDPEHFASALPGRRVVGIGAQRPRAEGAHLPPRVGTLQRRQVDTGRGKQQTGTLALALDRPTGEPRRT